MPELRIPVDHLSTGVFIRLDLKWYEHPFLFGSFKIKNPEQIQILKELGLKEVFYIPEKSDRQPGPSPTPFQKERAPIKTTPAPGQTRERLWTIKKERIERLRERNRRIQHCEKEYRDTIAGVSRVTRSLMTGSAEAGKQVDALIHDMTDSLLPERDVLVHLLNANGNDEGAFYHSLNVAILAMLLGKEYGVQSQSMKELGLGAIFHDMGKRCIPKKVLYRRTPLTTAERKLIELHPKYGVEIASRIPEFPGASLEIIRQHHETNDGEGYPEGLVKHEISLLSKMTSIANVYDNYCNQRDSSDLPTPHEALSHMFARQRTEFDQDLLTIFIRCLGLYPPGTIVQLSNDLMGIVVSVNAENQLCPNVLVYNPDIPRNQALIVDLEEEPDIRIERSIRPAQLTPEVHTYLAPRSRVMRCTRNAGRKS